MSSNWTSWRVTMALMLPTPVVCVTVSVPVTWSVRVSAQALSKATAAAVAAIRQKEELRWRMAGIAGMAGEEDGRPKKQALRGKGLFQGGGSLRRDAGGVQNEWLMPRSTPLELALATPAGPPIRPTLAPFLLLTCATPAYSEVRLDRS